MKPEDEEVFAQREDEPDSERMIWLSEQAESFLNYTVANEGYQFGWADGEFYYQENFWWEEAIY